MAELDDVLNQPSESETRIKQLSGKLREEAEARETERQGRETAEKAKQEAERERDFYIGFSDAVSNNPAAKEFKDDIKAKVLSGYSVEDATYAVLGKAGKIGTQVVAETPPSPAGGSASYTPPSGEKKDIAQMSRDEKFSALMEAEQRGDLSWS